MGALAWGNLYDFERGDIVSFRYPHPFRGQIGVMDSAQGDHQYGVMLADETEVVAWSHELVCLHTHRWDR